MMIKDFAKNITEKIEKSVPYWVKILLAAIAAGGIAEITGIYKFSKSQDTIANKENIEFLKEDREEFKRMYMECNRKYNLMQSELAIINGKMQLIGAISNDLPMPMWLKDMDGKMLFLNKEYERVFLLPRGYTSEDYIGKTDYDVWPKATADKYRENDRIAALSSKPTSFRIKVPTMTGRMENWRSTKYQRNIGNTIVGIGGFALKMEEYE